MGRGEPLPQPLSLHPLPRPPPPFWEALGGVFAWLGGGGGVRALHRSWGVGICVGGAVACGEQSSGGVGRGL